MAEIEVPFWKPYVTWDMVKDRWEGLIRAGKLSGGRIGAYHENVQELEEKVAKLHDRKYGVATHSGSGALMLAIQAMGNRRPDLAMYDPRIISPAFTFGAIPHIAKLLNMEIVYGDIDPLRWTMDKDLVPLQSGTGIIVPVCMFGNRPFWPDANRPYQWLFHQMEAKHSGIVYDAAHGVGTDLGAFDPVCLSFSPGKVLNSIEGGMILTDDEDLAADLRGEAFKLSRMSELEAAYALTIVNHLPYVLQEKKKLDEYYRSSLGDLLTFQTSLASTNHYQPCALAAMREERDHIIAYARERGVSIMAYYESLSPACPTAVDIGQRVLAFPAWVNMTAEQQQHVVQVVSGAVKAFRSRAAP